jgi:hypothetical protein
VPDAVENSSLWRGRSPYPCQDQVSRTATTHGWDRRYRPAEDFAFCARNLCKRSPSWASFGARSSSVAHWNAAQNHTSAQVVLNAQTEKQAPWIYAQRIKPVPGKSQCDLLSCGPLRHCRRRSGNSSGISRLPRAPRRKVSMPRSAFIHGGYRQRNSKEIFAAAEQRCGRCTFQGRSGNKCYRRGQRPAGSYIAPAFAKQPGRSPVSA